MGAGYEKTEIVFRAFCFSLDIFLWYVFTVFSTIYSKSFLDLTRDPHTLTLTSFAYPAILKLILVFINKRLKHPSLYIISLLTSREYLALGLFNVTTILLTNVGICETSVSLTYMVKASEPIFVLILSYVILGETQSKRVLQTLVPICLGVSMIVSGASAFNVVGFSCALAANIASAARNVFYKSKFHQQDSTSTTSSDSPFHVFLNVGLVSFLLYTPFFVLHGLVSLPRFSVFMLLDYYTFLTDYTLAPFSSPLTLQHFIYASLFNFLYNLFSLRVLSGVAPISHSIINIMKRVFIVFCSMLTFATPVTSMQWIGMLLADVGVFCYSIMKMHSNSTKTSSTKVIISIKPKSLYMKLVFGLVAFILLRVSINPAKGYLRFDENNNKLESNNRLFDKYNHTMRLNCIKRIEAEIRSVSYSLIPRHHPAHLLDYPGHRNLGDSFIWHGEELLLGKLGVRVVSRLDEKDERYSQVEYLEFKILPNHTILFHGGGNFGDLYPEHNSNRHTVMTNKPHSKIIVFPQTINYRNRSLASEHARLLAAVTNLSIMTRSFESYEFARLMFAVRGNTGRVVMVPDMAFMIGALKPLRAPRVDLILLQRTDFEASHLRDEWSMSLKRILSQDDKYLRVTYLIRDWFDYWDVKSIFDSDDEDRKAELAKKRVDLGNEILSLGRVVITDRLHASVLSVLMGKAHVMINDKYKKVEWTRETAFHGKPECSKHNIRGYYASNIDDAIHKALRLLELQDDYKTS